MLLKSIKPKIDLNRLSPTIESKNLVTMMIISNYEQFDFAAKKSLLTLAPSAVSLKTAPPPPDRTSTTTAGVSHQSGGRIDSSRKVLEVTPWCLSQRLQYRMVHLIGDCILEC